MSDSPAPSPLPPEPPSEPAAAPSATTPPAASPSAASEPSAESPGLPPNIAACLACFPLVGGIVFLIIEKKNPFVRFYAMQSAILGLAAMGFSIVLEILVKIFAAIPILGWLVLLLLGLVGVVFVVAVLVAWIVTGFNAFSNKEWEIPYLGKIARDQLTPRTPTAPQ